MWPRPTLTPRRVALTAFPKARTRTMWCRHRSHETWSSNSGPSRALGFDMPTASWPGRRVIECYRHFLISLPEFRVLLGSDANPFISLGDARDGEAEIRCLDSDLCVERRQERPEERQA